MPADDVLLLLDRHLVPPLQVMQIFLHDHITTAGKIGIFIAHERGGFGGLPSRIFGAVDKADQIAVVEKFKAMHLVRDRNRAGEPGHDVRGKLEAQVHARRTDMKEDVAGR